ncbi:hypothetical protein [Rickettsia endosymbiont of Oedothorax gibbosus]|nr:hypothetical protein [Rickettsia endosymbiont of Oedothorax gibbosus]
MQFTILKKTRILKNITIMDVLFHTDAWNDYRILAAKLRNTI